MIGSPWNPFFTQTIPGTATRFDGRSVVASEFQTGAADAVGLPQHVTVNRKTIATDGTFVEGEVVLTRRFELLPFRGARVNAEVLQAIFGDKYATKLSNDILNTGFLWWWQSVGSFAGMIPRVIYWSDAFDQFGNEVEFVVPGEIGSPEFGDDDFDIPRVARRWFLAFGFSHAGINFPEDAAVEVPLPPSDYREVWSLWHSADFPVAEGGRGVSTSNESSANDLYWFPVPGVTLVEPGEEPYTYPLFISQGGVDVNIPEGSSIWSADYNRPVKMVNVTTSISRDEITVKPWYREG